MKVLQGISPYCWSNLDLTNSSTERISAILESRGLALNKLNYDILKTKTPYGHITLIEQRCTKLDDLNDINLDDNDLRLLLSSNIKNEIKIALIKKEEARIITNGLLCETCVSVFKKNIDEQWSQKILSSVIKESKDYLFSIKLILAHKDQFDVAVIIQFIKNLPKLFNDLAKPGKRPLLTTDPIVYDFLEFLKSINLVSTYNDIDTKNGKRIKSNNKRK